MPWSDDIRCLYCDGRLPLYRKITNGQFCSAAHRKAYWHEQERLAVERLHQTHDTLRAFRPGAHQEIEAIVGRVTVEPETPAPFLAPALAAEAPRPWWMTLVNSGEVPMGAFCRVAAPTQACWPQDGIAGREVQLLDYSKSVRRPFHLYAPFDCGFEFAGAVAPQLRAAAAGTLASEAKPLDVAICPVARVAVDLHPVFEALEIVEEEIPPFAGLVALARPAFCEGSANIAGAMPLEITIRAQFPLDQVVLQVALGPAELLIAGLRQLPVDQMALVPGTWIDSLRALDLRAETDTPRFTLATPPLRPRLRLAAGRRYTVATREGSVGALAAEERAIPATAPAVSLPERNARPLRGAAASAPQTQAAKEPNAAGMVALRFDGCAVAAPGAAPQAPQTFADPQIPRPEPLRPRARLEPMAMPAIPLTDATPDAVEENGFEPPSHLRHLVDFWNRAPRDLKILGIAVPLMLMLAMHPALPKVHVAAPSGAASLQHDVEKAWNEQMVNVKQTVTDRAAVALDEDFRAGLDDWVSRGDATTEWSFDATGFVRPGPLALYRPSMGLNDYEMQFLGMIDKKALSWVVRAADFNNFYVIKLVVIKGGPLPTIGVTRYAVVNGKADSRVDRIALIDAREDMLYRVRMDVHGDDYVLTVQGQLVDAWSEPRLTHGGIGFFTARGEESRVRWVQVTHQYDMLGRLCAYLAPYNITPTTSGSWEQ